MRLYSEWVLKFQKPDWSRNPEFGVIDTILELRPDIIQLFKSDVIGYEDISKIRQDSTVVKSNIHYPTNNSLVWDCINESHRLLSHLKEEVGSFSFIDYTKSAKSTYFKINVTRSKDKQVDLFNKQLITFTKAINQVSNTVKKKFKGLKAYIIVAQLQALIPTMEQVYSMAYWKQITGENVPNDQKLFSIYESLDINNLKEDINVSGEQMVNLRSRHN